MWNEHFQVVTNEVVTTLQEMPAEDQLGVLTDITNKLATSDDLSL
jgi:hypothetical protein